MNLDQTPCYLVPCKKFTMAKKGSNNLQYMGATIRERSLQRLSLPYLESFCPCNSFMVAKHFKVFPDINSHNHFP